MVRVLPDRNVALRESFAPGYGGRCFPLMHGQLVFYICYRMQRRRYVEVVESVCARVRSDSRDGSLTQAGRSMPCVDDAPEIHSFRIVCMECDQRTLHRAGPISVQISPMTSAALCLSLALQLPVAPDPLTLDSDSLATLQQALQTFGAFQHPYSAPIDAYDPDAGVIDASVEVSAGCLQEGPKVIVLDDDGDETPERYLVLVEPWQSLPAGTLLLVCGDRAVVISAQDWSRELARAEIMLTFLDLLPGDSEARDQLESCSAVSDSDTSDPFVKSILDQLCASTPGTPVTDTALALWKGRLPDALLALWQRDGLARYHDDRLTMVDPAQYETVLAALLAGSPPRDKDNLHVYAISPFGQMLICGEKTGVDLTLEPHEGYLCAPAALTLPASNAVRNRSLHDFLLTLDDPELDVLTEDEEPMFWRVREMLGPLGDGEIYTSTEPVPEHGWRIDRLVKRKALDVLAELAQRR